MLQKISLIIAFVFSSVAMAQEHDFIPLEVSVNKFTTGTLLAPNQNSPAVPLVIIIQSSGQTDRDGNQAFAKNNAFKYLANNLAKNGIASYRYDKRIFQMREVGIREKEIRFDDFIEDAASIIKYFNEQERFYKIIVAGHGEGSLIGMLAAQQTNVDGFISLTAEGRPVDEVILDQVANQLPGLKENAANALKEMKEKGSTSSYDPVLEFVFNPELQPFLISWMKYDPAEEISELKIPALIVAGTLDSQVPVEDAELLKENNPEAELLIVKNMNHVLKDIEIDDDLVNAKSYNEPGRPLHPQLVPKLVEFINGIK